MFTPSRRWPLLVSLLVVLSLGLAACGDDDDETTESGSGATTTEAPAQQAAFTAYCEKSLQIETVPDPDIDFESASEAEIQEGLKKYASESFVPLAKEVQAVTPEEIKADVAVLVAAVEKVAQTGDFSPFEEDPAVLAAEDRVHEFDLKNCGWGKQDVMAVDYGFTGVTPDVKAGAVSFELKNGGKEMHELTLLKKKAGVTESFDDIVKLSEEEGMKKVDFAGSLEPIKPGEDGYVVTKLEKGEYLAVCFLPQGFTPDFFAKVQAGEAQPPEDAPPHAALGMRAAFTVA